MQLTLGPVLYHWQPEQWRDFYFRIAEEAPVDVVVVGEIVCSKRSPFFAEHMPVVIERLAACGKQVVLGSLILVSLQRERRQMAELAGNTDFMVEANDLSCFGSLAGRPYAIGPFVNIYNEATAAYFAGRGRVGSACPPNCRWTRSGPSRPLCQTSQRRSLPSVACRWRSPHAVIMPAFTSCQRTIAVSFARKIRTG